MARHSSLLSIPKGKKGQQKRIMLAGGATLALVLVLYFAYAPFRNQINKYLKIKGGGGKAVDVAPSVEFDSPPAVKPNSQFTIKGRFVDEKGKTVTVKRAYFYLYNGNQIAVQGIIGDNIAEFEKVIPTAGLVMSDNYQVVVTDRPEQAQSFATPNIPHASATGLGFVPSDKSNMAPQNVGFSTPASNVGI